MSSAVYLDHAGAAQFLPEQIEAHMRQLTQCLFSNPHSRSASSKLTTDVIDQVRYRILEHFNTTNDYYSVIFTSGCTAALKLLSESLDWSFLCHECQQRRIKSEPRNRQIDFSSQSDWQLPGPKFVYLMDNHTSVIGMREYALRAEAIVHCLRPDDMDEFLRSQELIKNRIRCHCIRLFVFPGQSNFCGRKYILENWIDKFHSLNWLVCLDAASLVSSSQLYPNMEKPDFVTLSFYKIFGYPTGLGALLVRTDTGLDKEKFLLKKRYFGGGTVRVALNAQNFVSYRTDSLSDRFEDGTVAYQQILALKHGFDALKTRGGIAQVSSQTFTLASCAYRALSKIKHANGSPIAKIYCHDQFNYPNTQGPIINFNFLRPDGSYVGYAEAEKMAELYDIHWRTGCFCNQGACQLYLGISDESLMDNFESGKVCGDEIDLINGQPVGSIRISFGWTSTISDVQHFIRMVWECFVDRGSVKKTLEEAIEEFSLEFKIGEGHTEKSIMSNGRGDGQSAHFVNLSTEVLKSSARDPQRHRQNHYVKNQKPDQSENENFYDAIDIPHHSLNNHHHSDFFLTDIYLFPIKSCSAIRLTEWSISDRGLLHDRHWMIVTGEGLCLNQKREPKMCMIKPELRLEENRLVLNSDHIDRSLSVPFANICDGRTSDTAIAGPYCQSKVCADRVSTADCGDVVGEWIDEVLGRNGCRLVTQTNDIPRKGKGSQHAEVSLVNEEQYLLVHRPSIRRLLSLISATSPHITEDELILRFRPNLVVDGGVPFDEDNWQTVRIGEVDLQCVGKCTRCQMICVDQNTGEMDKNILLALRELRNLKKTTFGIYLQAMPNQAGKTMRVGQQVIVTHER